MRFIHFGIIIPVLGMRGGDLHSRSSTGMMKRKDDRFPRVDIQFSGRAGDHDDSDSEDSDHESSRVLAEDDDLLKFESGEDDDGLHGVALKNDNEDFGFDFEGHQDTFAWDEADLLGQKPSNTGKVNPHRRGQEWEDDADEEEDAFMTVLDDNGLWNVRKNQPMGILEHSGMRLRLGKTMDEGGSAVILSATDESTNKKYVVKLGELTHGNGDDNIEAEYHITSDLKSEGGIIRVYGDLGTLVDRRQKMFNFMVLEKLDADYGSIIEGYLRKPLASRIKFVSSFAYYAILTLRKLHENNNIAHCDIHSKAFMQKSSDNLYRLIDFGKARRIENHHDEERGCLDSRGNWICTDNVDLLSPFELLDKVCQPRDDLIRLASILIRSWPSNSIALGARAFYSDYEGRRGSTKGSNVSKTKVEKMYNWKRDYSLLKHFGTSISQSPGDFPPGAETGTSFIDEFYRVAQSLEAVDEIHYDDLLDLFITKSGADDHRLTTREASAIARAYTLPVE